MNSSTGAVANATNNVSDEMMELPIVVSYLILVFRIASTVYVSVVGIAVVVVVIKNKDKFRGRHVLLVVNLMVSGILSAVNATVQSSVMIIGYIIGMDDPIRCDIFFVTLSTFHVNAFALLVLAIDKFIAVVNPLRYASIVTDRVVYVMIFLSWTVSILFCIIRLFIKETYQKSSQYGACIPERESFVSLMINFVGPIFISFLVALIIDTYSSVTACKLNKRSRQHCEDGLQAINSPQCSTSDGTLAKLRQKLDRITGKNTKPIIAVCIGLASNSVLGFLCPILFVTVQTLEMSISYKFFVENIVIPNAAYGFLIVYSLIYSMYYTNIRRPMCSMMKHLVRAMCPVTMGWPHCLRRRRSKVMRYTGQPL